MVRPSHIAPEWSFVPELLRYCAGMLQVRRDAFRSSDRLATELHPGQLAIVFHLNRRVKSCMYRTACFPSQSNYLCTRLAKSPSQSHGCGL